MNTLSINIAWGWKFACSLDWIAELLLVTGTVKWKWLPMEYAISSFACSAKGFRT
jgi:hypothetical protein